MNVLFFVFITLVFVIFQTIVSPCFFWFAQSFDVTIMLVLFLSLHFSHHAVVLAIVFIGSTMDSLSGGPFFLYTFSYIWMYLIVQLVKQIVFQTSGLFIVVISMLLILIQQGLVFFSVFIQQGKAAAWQMDFTLMGAQLLWGTLLIPPGVWLLSLCYRNWCYMVQMLQKSWEHKVRN